MSVEFCKTYSQLIGLSPDAPASAFHSTENYNQLGSLGPSLPKVEHAFPKTRTPALQDAAVDIHLRSIRPPYKFSTTLQSVHSSQSVYKVKSLLVSAVDALQQAGVTPSNLKFMIKSKVLTDSTSISSLVPDGTELSITVMVSAPSADKSPEPAAGSDADPPAISAGTWGKIHDLLVAEVGAENGQRILGKFRSVA
ncbi:hypothetical protein METBIDRAFT_10763 [Metschnikowia bicuspidata var. bicuspidata NRRL YB-4993]|uniref:Ubiquitin-like domain-containing protein n=1 Tax=Metschnikowia bicuspidata var. bicuspidata NRRL YB-4993 TaxID=869754 RepID=A0A1A0HD64_9ASCO|nr:hypothetical protein METBIDRAFT_10763 [Metschnikowia bicuspidata var. bicuspidata NRRL YB-4993]OBA21837.1 hypothetical protein METBIDRAFT_10763 [Metschnikowia bicuspidata var. bicuspidata NRRL YB-4993]